MQNLFQFFWLTCCVLFGGLITWLVSKRYYLKASEELKDATKEINKMLHFIVHILEQNGQFEIKRDDQGNIIGLIISANIIEPAHAQDVTDAAIIKQS
jgi:hypothetical protein